MNSKKNNEIGKLPAGEAVFTSAGKLNAKIIIHTSDHFGAVEIIMKPNFYVIVIQIHLAQWVIFIACFDEENYIIYKNELSIREISIN